MEREPKLPSIDAELAARVKEKLGWDYPIDDGEQVEGVLSIDEQIEQARGLAGDDPILGALADDIENTLKGKE